MFFEFYHALRWCSVKVQLSINIHIVHVLPPLYTQLVCVADQVRVWITLITSCLYIKGLLLKAHADSQQTLLLICQSAASGISEKGNGNF